MHILLALELNISIFYHIKLSCDCLGWKRFLEFDSIGNVSQRKTFFFFFFLNHEVKPILLMESLRKFLWEKEKKINVLIAFSIFHKSGTKTFLKVVLTIALKVSVNMYIYVCVCVCVCVWRECTSSLYILYLFHIGFYIFISPLLVPKSINALYFGHYRYSLNKNCWCGKRSLLLAH